jgi:hypothetical protein
MDKTPLLQIVAIVLAAAGAVSASFDLSQLLTGFGVLGSLGCLGLSGGLVSPDPD